MFYKTICQHNINLQKYLLFNNDFVRINILFVIQGNC